MLSLKFVFNREFHFMNGNAGSVRPMEFREFDKASRRRIAPNVLAVKRETGLEGDD
jgi:hypothetical protein